MVSRDFMVFKVIKVILVIKVLMENMLDKV